MFRRKRVWIPILSVLVIAMGCGLFYGRKVANQEPVKIYKAVEVETKPKPPPPGETHESGHWHGDEWHTGSHDAHAPAEVATPVDAQSAQPVNAQLQDQANAQIPAPTRDPSEEPTRTRTPQEVAEIQRQRRVWNEWWDKLDELDDAHFQADLEYIDTLALVDDERYETDENFRREANRKSDEAWKKSFDAAAAVKEHEATKPSVPPSLKE